MPLGAGGTLGLAMGLILDFYTAKESAAIISLGVTSFGVFPSIATIFAGFLVPISWILPLHLLSCYYIFLLMFVQSIPDVQEKPEKISISNFIKGVGKHLIEGKYIVYACMWSFITTAMYFYTTYASLMAVKLWG